MILSTRQSTHSFVGLEIMGVVVCNGKVLGLVALIANRSIRVVNGASRTRRRLSLNLGDDLRRDLHLGVLVELELTRRLTTGHGFEAHLQIVVTSPVDTHNLHTTQHLLQGRSGESIDLDEETVVLLARLDDLEVSS